jgi:hypothetical protein
MISYQEALSRCLEALAEGRELDSVIEGLPSRHRQRLRQDATLAQAVRRAAASVPPPSSAAEVNALTRLNAELSSVRVSRRATPARGGLFGLGVPRFALAGLLLAALLVGASFIVGPNRGDDGTVEAASFEGVVVANLGGSLTVQTLDTLEEVTVPLDAAVLDENGATLELGAIEAGEVIMVRGDREHGGPVRALDIRRLVDGLPGWCDENPERCRQIAQKLSDAQQRCDSQPDTCQLLRDRVADVIGRATDVANLEDLRLRCRDGSGDECQDFTTFCRDHTDLCIRNIPPGPVTDRLDEAQDRLRRLDSLCSGRDTVACRQIAQLCGDHPVLCPSDKPTDQRPAR